jgi:hypothetical protein
MLWLLWPIVLSSGDRRNLIQNLPQHYGVNLMAAVVHTSQVITLRWLDIMRYPLGLDWSPNLCGGIIGSLHRGLIKSNSIILVLGIEGPREDGQRGNIARIDGYMRQ